MKPSTMKVLLVLLGVALGVLALVVFQHLWPRPCPANKGPLKGKDFHASSDPPVGGQGGSFALHGSGTWTVSNNGKRVWAAADVIKNGQPVTPNVFSLDGVDAKDSYANPRPILDITPDGNWSIVLDYRDNSGHKEDQLTTLSICTKLDDTSNPKDCIWDTTSLTTTKIYLLSSADLVDGTPSGTLQTQTIDRGHDGINPDQPESIFFDLKKCGTTSPPDRHDLCGHPWNVTLNYYKNGSEVSETYRCVDGACSVGIDHQ
jgi:hypothetical protein